MMTDHEIAKKVIESCFGKKQAAKTKEEAEMRLFVAHTLINSVLLNNATTGGILERWEDQVGDIEGRLEALRTALNRNLGEPI
jgi:hypothetical protein